MEAFHLFTPGSPSGPSGQPQDFKTQAQLTSENTRRPALGTVACVPVRTATRAAGHTLSSSRMLMAMTGTGTAAYTASVVASLLASRTVRAPSVARLFVAATETAARVDQFAGVNRSEPGDTVTAAGLSANSDKTTFAVCGAAVPEGGAGGAGCVDAGRISPTQGNGR